MADTLTPPPEYIPDSLLYPAQSPQPLDMSQAPTSAQAPDTYTPPVVDGSTGDETQRFMQRVYGWMAFALMVSGATAWGVANSETLVSMVFGGGGFFILILIEFALVIGLSRLVQRMNATVATILFVLYSFVTGATLSVVFLVYELGSIVSVFGISAGIFGSMSAYGYSTRRDLTGIGTLAMFGLMGIIIAGVINLFVRHNTAGLVLDVIGVVVFVALTAYDTQKIKSMNILGNEGTDEDKKEAIMGALTLYLDFINLFLKLLSLFGKRK